VSRYLERARVAGNLLVDSDGRPRFRSALHHERVASALGLVLGFGFVVCFVTGVLSHLIQDPPSWFSWPPRPAGLYRVTQGLHVATGLALIPLLFTKLWVVYPHLFAWPPVRSGRHAVERVFLLPLIGASLVLVVTGLGNINLWRPWDFPFRAGHYAAAWIAVGGLVVHVTAKRAGLANLLRRRRAGSEAPAEPPAAGAEADRRGGLDRRSFVGATMAASGAVVLFTVGQSLPALRRLALLAPRRPDVGPQGLPVNRTAASVGLERVDLDGWRLVVDGPGVSRPLALTYDDLRTYPHREAELPIACVEGWSASARWRGVPVREVLRRAGAAPGAHAVVVAMHDSPRQRTSELTPAQIADPDTLLAVEVNGEVLAPDHGFPVRLIGPNRPGVQQTKWLALLEVHP
jgi:DMSO/TMAO reductase YedYZ molybdopterin-dependent catalytic subunit